MMAILIIFPLLAAIAAISLLKDYSKAKYVAIGGAVVSAVLLPLVSYGSNTFSWFAIGKLVINLTFSVTPLNLMLLALVSVIAILVLVYSSGYINSPLEQKRYYIEILAFQAAMSVFAVSGNFIVLFIAWEFLSLTSYLLIGFWNRHAAANRAARRALTIIFIGDLALLGSIIIFWHVFGTFGFAQILSSVASQTGIDTTIAVLLLLTAIFTKSAQFPFHEWLIDAMEGPTPVSAFLHSSTMVKAGVFVVILLYPLFLISGIRAIILVFGLATALISTLAATREMHIKKVIAYSTIQELSIMLVAVSSGAVLAAIYFFFVQSFYKALLFFSAGVITKSTGKEKLNEISGLRYNKLAYIATIFGALSLAGFIPFSGFFSNAEVSTALYSNFAVYAIMSGISILTSFYIIRWLSYGAKDTKNSAVQTRYMGLPGSMVYPMAALAVLTVAASAAFLYVGGFLNFGGYLAYLPIQASAYISITDGIFFTVLIAIGAVLSYNVYYRNCVKSGSKAFDRIIYTRQAMEFGYDLVSRVMYGLSAGIAEFDSYLNEGFDRIGRVTVRSGYGIRRFSVGNINSYALIFIIGVLVLFVSFYFLVVL